MFLAGSPLGERPWTLCDLIDSLMTMSSSCPGSGRLICVFPSTSPVPVFLPQYPPAVPVLTRIFLCTEGAELPSDRTQQIGKLPPSGLTAILSRLLLQGKKRPSRHPDGKKLLQLTWSERGQSGMPSSQASPQCPLCLTCTASSCGQCSGSGEETESPGHSFSTA